MTELNKIDTSTKEGRLLMAAIAVITSESRTSSTPNEVLTHIIELSKKMYDDDGWSLY